MSTSLSGNYYFSRIAGLMLLVLSSAGIWKGLQKGYSPILLMLTIIIPYTVTSILGMLQLFGQRWVRVPIILICLTGLLLNIHEALQYPNRKDIIEIVVFLSVSLLVTADFVGNRNASH